MSKMFNKLSNSGSTTVTDQLGLDSEVRELKFGSSFNPGNRGQSGAFHSIKYDFKPASVDKSKAATLEVGPNGQVSISMPHYDSNGSTVFKGSTRPYTKECVLIIDKDTGEIVLEKLSHNVQVKKTRQEGSGKNSSKETGNLPQSDAGPASGRSSSFNNNGQRNDYPSSREREEERESSSRGFTSKRTVPASVLNPPSSNHGHGRRPNSPLPPNTTGLSTRHSPVPSHTTFTTGHSPSPSSFETHGGKSNSSAAAFDGLMSKQVNAPAMLSLTSIEDLLTTTPPPPPPHQPSHSSSSKNDAHQQKPATVAPVIQGSGNTAGLKHKHSTTSDKKSAGDTMIMSDSSDDSSSSSSSEEDDDDSSSASDMEDVALPPSIAGPGPAVVPMDTSSRGNPTTSPAPSRVQVPPPTHNVPGSMPNFFDLADNMPSHVLSEDLQLSESGSSSDSD